MSDRAAALSDLADRLADREGVVDAWTAKSFTDRLFVVEVPANAYLPAAVRETVHAHDLREAHEAGRKRPARGCLTAMGRGEVVSRVLRSGSVRPGSRRTP